MLNHINHKMPIYKDCTLIELLAVAIATLIALTLIFSILSIIFIGQLWPGYLLASLLFYFVTKFLLSKLQQLKYGKPYGYYQQWGHKKLAELKLMKSVYLMRIGRWSVRRALP